MSIASPIWLVTLLVPALALAAYLWVEKRGPGRYAVSFPNLAVLAGVARGGRQWRRHLTAASARRVDRLCSASESRGRT